MGEDRPGGAPDRLWEDRERGGYSCRRYAWSDFQWHSGRDRERGRLCHPKGCYQREAGHKDLRDKDKDNGQDRNAETGDDGDGRDTEEGIAMPPAVEVQNITKKFGELTAVDDVSFSVAEGEFFGFLGPNGAGKTTLIRILTTLIRPTSGKAKVACCDVIGRPEEVRREIGVVPQAMTSDLDLTGYENMDIYGRFYGIRSKERKERINYLLEIVGLAARANDLVATYSGGMRRRLEVARVLVH